MAQLSNCVEPFGEVNVFKDASGNLTVKATVLMVPDVENAKTALALDASASMREMYGAGGNPLFGGGANQNNLVEPVARTMAAFLAGFSSDASCYLTYWACAPDGSATEEIGRFKSEQLATIPIQGPKRSPWGRQTRLLPPVKLFAEHVFVDTPWAIGVIVTDGIIDDLPDVKAYCLKLGKEIAAGKHAFLKLVLIGLGKQVNEAQMEELDDMFEGSGLKTPAGEEIDIWDHKLAADMKKLDEIFSEVVDENTIVTSSGKVLDAAGNVAKEYSDGVPAVLKFTLPKGSTSFTLEWPGGNVKQDISEVLGRL
jgi:hypothetical protein